MLDAETTALLRNILNEVCAVVSRYETGARVHVASKLLESATKGEISLTSCGWLPNERLVDAPT